MTPAELFNKYARSYSEKFMDVSLYAQTLDLFCTQMPKNSGLLDIACGPGNIARYLHDKMPGIKITGIDLAPDMLDIAREAVPAAEFLLMDCRDISLLPTLYDGIVCAFVLPYLGKEDALKLMQDCSEKLSNTGVLYLSFMEGANSDSNYVTNSGGDTVFLNYHEVQYITDALTGGGCDIVNVTRMPSPPNTSVQTNDVILVALKK